MLKYVRKQLHALLENRKFQKWLNREEEHLYHKILKNQFEITKLELKEMRRKERLERTIRKRKPQYIC